MTSYDTELREAKKKGQNDGYITRERRNDNSDVGEVQHMARQGIDLLGPKRELLIDNLCLIQCFVLHVSLREQRTAAL